MRATDDSCEEVIAWFRRDLGALVARSYVHTNRFLKLARSLPGRPEIQVRLHHWPSDWPTRWSSIHNHRWDFTTLVLAGQLDEMLYECDFDASDGPDQLYAYRRHDLTDAGPEEVVAGHRVGLRRLSVRRRVTGNLDFVRGDQFHQIKARPATTTLVLRGPVRYEAAQIALPLGRRPQLADRLRAMTPKEIGDAIDGAWDGYRADRGLPVSS